MKKKLLLGLLVFIALFTITGCVSKKSNKWEYSKEDFDSFNNAFSDKALNQEDSNIDIIYVHDIKLNDNINKDDVLIFNYDNLEQDIDYENNYVSYDLIKKYQINVDKIDITSDHDTLRVYFYGEDDLFINYGVLINKDATKDQKYIITKTQKEYLGNDEDYNGVENLTFAPLFSYLDSHGISMEKLIEDGVINELVAESFANNDNLTLKTIGRVCSYLGINVEDVMKFEKSGVHEPAHEITWNTEVVKKRDYKSKYVISYDPLRSYMKENGITQYQMVKEGVISYSHVTRLSFNYNYTVKFIMHLCRYLNTDVYNVVEFVEP